MQRVSLAAALVVALAATMPAHADYRFTYTLDDTWGEGERVPIRFPSYEFFIPGNPNPGTPGGKPITQELLQRHAEYMSRVAAQGNYSTSDLLSRDPIRNYATPQQMAYLKQLLGLSPPPATPPTSNPPKVGKTALPTGKPTMPPAPPFPPSWDQRRLVTIDPRMPINGAGSPLGLPSRIEPMITGKLDSPNIAPAFDGSFWTPGRLHSATPMFKGK